ncbi:hypothetical protein NQ315_012680 [Exocentrus adspersus]|uniref:Defensin n=1 Tax=Exocentrus adspersus TaxID=1586481 RepID=A0AAV8VSB0_9CUCU|nr:hypothetical protein NQ315_012680 [Exocentrus adspersus]
MKATLAFVLIFAVSVAVATAVPAAALGDANAECTVSNCSRFCQSIHRFGGFCIGNFCQCYDF